MASARIAMQVPASRIGSIPAGSAAVGARRVRTWPPPSALLGIVVLTALALLAIAGPWMWRVDPEAQDLINRLAPPWGLGGTAAHPLGTDTLGRDTVARLIAGARISLPLAALATVAAAALGVSLGVLAGYRGGWVDGGITWLTDVQLAIPFVVFAIVVTVTLGNSFRNVLVILVVTGWVAYARVVRMQARAMRSSAWMEAAKSIGASPWRLMGRHLLPNLLGPVLVLATQQAGAMIFYEASLSFLGLGIGGSVPTWGGMAALGREAVFKAPWVAAIPGAAIALAILGFNLTGDWLATRGRRQTWQ
jgi:peptide/nickel transport system permease protein